MGPPGMDGLDTDESILYPPGVAFPWEDGSISRPGAAFRLDFSMGFVRTAPNVFKAVINGTELMEWNVSAGATSTTSPFFVNYNGSLLLVGIKNTVGVVFDLGNQWRLTGVFSPASFSTIQNNYSPASLNIANRLRLTATALTQITGLDSSTGVGNGTSIILHNIGTVAIQLTHQDTGSLAVNRFTCPNGNTYVLGAGKSVEVVYDSTSTTWRLIGAGGDETAHLISASTIIPAGQTQMVTRYVEIAAGVTLEIGLDADLEVS